MKTFSQSKRELIKAEGVVHYPNQKKYIVSVNINNVFHSLRAFTIEQDAIDFYNNWVVENR